VDWDGITISILYAGSVPSLPGRQWAFTMWEDTRVRDDWVAAINATCQLLLVPCPHNADVFKQSGVHIPIHVVHLGIDPVEFPVLPVRTHQRPYTFLAWGDRGVRKGWGEAFTAFSNAFPKDCTDVRLIIKCRPDQRPPMRFTDRRIRIWCDDVVNMADVYAHADCVVFPAKGEGWGFPPREAAAMGIPAIATNWSGLEVGINEWGIPLDKLTLCESLLDGAGGQWAHPDYQEIAEKMRWCYDNRAEAAAVGTKAAAWLRANQTWQHTADMLKGLLEKHA
jgi:glycosyltransferase involved in cell wall biosynthesis